MVDSWRVNHVPGAVVVVVVPAVEFVSVFGHSFVGGCSPCAAREGIFHEIDPPFVSLWALTVGWCPVCSVEGAVLVLFAVFVGAVVGVSVPPRFSVVAGDVDAVAVVGVGVVAVVVVVVAAFVMHVCR